MPRLMSVSLTETAVVERRKTVTRRLSWEYIQPGDRLWLCKKVMGHKPGEPLERLALVEVVSVRRERLDAITPSDVVAEGVPLDEFFVFVDPSGEQPTPEQWVRWFCHQMRCVPDTEVTRIEWRYLDPEATDG